MPRRLSAVLAALAAFASGSADSALAANAVVVDRSDLAPSIAYPISSSVMAVDASFAPQTRLDTLTVWLQEVGGTKNGVFENFSGTLSWAVYEDNAGMPGNLLYSGSDASPAIVVTGLGALDIVRARIDLDGRPILSGSYWIAVHEGAWGSAYDDTEIAWVAASTVVGEPARVADDETAPGNWGTAPSDDLAFVAAGDAFIAGQTALTATGGGGYDVSDYVEAVDFTLADSTRLGSVDVWLEDGLVNDDGVLNTFTGTISWAIYSNAAGDPGSSLATGHDATPLLVDTGLNFNGRDLFRVRFELAPAPTLGAGTYWLLLHEGTWGSAFDSSFVLWTQTASIIGEPVHFADESATPGDWGFELADLAFVLFEDLIFGSGFESGSLCAWTEPTSSACP